ncbi:MAG: S8 family serine peptidase [Actinomycetota bacterium]|nr:S8 family serine peptidase [Actinomycetota bacterium]
MRKSPLLIAASALVVGAATITAPLAAGAAPSSTSVAASTTGQDYVVLYASTSSAAAARTAIAQAGGTIQSSNDKVGFAVVRGSAAVANAISGSSAVAGVARNRVIGVAPAAAVGKNKAVEKLTSERAAAKATAKGKAKAVSQAAVVAAEPLADSQWDMRQIGATPTGSYAMQPGNQGVLVGVIDTGIDGTHPDIAPNFDAADSQNFVTDMPDIDGPCEVPSCVDPANVDDDGHGTHVASTIASPINGIGIAGVAPNVRLVNLRAGQDSGFFFLAPTLNAITAAGDLGVDVINMSFFTDPWLFNCTKNPADSAAEQAEQRVIRTATQRAINYARAHGVLPISAAGNEHTDLGHPTVDDTSPDFPLDTARHRDVDNSCLSVPTETRGVMSVSSTGFSTRLAYYSNYGTEQTDVAAPGGDAYDTPTNTLDPAALILAAYPKTVGIANGDIDADGNVDDSGFVLKDCSGGGECSYYQRIQGTSMASPHAVGVAALIVSQYGKADRKHGGLTLDPSTTQRILEKSAVEHACPSPRDFFWHRVRPDGTTADATAHCSGPLADNGFYGKGIVNAYNAVTGRS